MHTSGARRALSLRDVLVSARTFLKSPQQILSANDRAEPFQKPKIETRLPSNFTIEWHSQIVVFHFHLLSLPVISPSDQNQRHTVVARASA